MIGKQVRKGDSGGQEEKEKQRRRGRGDESIMPHV